MTRFCLRRNCGPVYREILPLAFKTAWRDKKFWPLAFLASVLLSSGSYDVVLKAIQNVSDQSAILSQTPGRLNQIGVIMSSALTDSSNFLGIASGLQAVLVVAILLVTLAVLSCVSQAGLVYAIGAMKRAVKVKLIDAIRVGGGAFWPVAALNALALSVLWVLHFLVAFPLYLSLDQTTGSSWLLYFISFLVFMSLTFVVIIVQIFALNAMILQGAPLRDALIRGYMMFKKHWVVTVETTLLLLLAAMGVITLFGAALLILMVPLFAAVVAAAVIGSSHLLYGLLGLMLALLLAAIVVLFSFLTQFQYATWIYLYRRLGEGGVLPRLHRWMRSLSGGYSVPQR